MKIHIENFRNIESLDCEIEDNKVNFIYGISGTGKSSLVKAVSQAPGKKDAPIGKPGLTPNVTLNGGAPNYASVRVYNEESVMSLILNPIENENAYSALVGDESELIKLEDAFRASIADLRKKLPDMIERRDKIRALYKAFGPLENQQFAKRSGAKKIELELHGPKACSSTMSLLKKDAKYIRFINDGAKLPQYDHGNCPFCERKLSPSKISYIEAVRTVTQTTFKTIFDNTSLFADLGINEPIWTHKRSYSKFEKTLAEQIEIEKELSGLIEFCVSVDRNITDYAMPKELRITNSLLNVMPALKTPVDSINASALSYKKRINQMKAQFNNLVKDKTLAINANIALLGIPYKIEATNLDRGGKKVSYCIRHISDPAKENNGELLSAGEKNVLALLIFTMDKTGDVIIYDDPVSSYDEYRRSQLYKHILNETTSTVVVCSHDQSFVKQAIIDKADNRKEAKRIGLIAVFDNNNGKGTIRELFSDDFGSLRSFIHNQVKIYSSINYYRAIINLRLLCEIDGLKRSRAKTKHAAWSYTSAILHRKDRDTILNELSKIGVTEEAILAMFKEKYDLSIPPVPSNYSDAVDSTYTTFEKIIIGREQRGVKKVDKCVLDDIVHLNSSLAICLNPYKYTDYPKHIVLRVEAIVPIV